ncbi:MAG: 2-dehydropantoate 2-reductase [Deltaproteobacteria bacterium]|nr:2-dehydropantoate 2-reductase [Deltaproteobacteria bacterium]
MKIVIAGAGAMGCLFAGLLAGSRHELWLLEKDAGKVDAIRSAGLSIEISGAEPAVSMPSITAYAGDAGIADVLVLLVKAYDTAAAVQAALPVIGPQTTVLTLQNGLGNIEAITRAVPQTLLLAGTTAQGATLLGNGRVRHAGRGETVIGPLVPEGAVRAHAVQEIFQSAGIPATVAEDIQPVLWGKLLVNAGINALTAIMRVKNGRVGDMEPLQAVMRRAVAEGAAVAQRLGISLPYPDPVVRTTEICCATAENFSSMYQDISLGRRTEIDSINGVIVEYANRLGLPVPVNCMLTRMVHALECPSVS